MMGFGSRDYPMMEPQGLTGDASQGPGPLSQTRETTNREAQQLFLCQPRTEHYNNKTRNRQEGSTGGSNSS